MAKTNDHTHLHWKWLLAAACMLTIQLTAAQDKTTIAKRLVLLDSIYTRIINSYVLKPSEEQLFRSGIDASLNKLDPFTNYMNVAEANEFKLGLKARFGGIGFIIGEMNNDIFVREVFKGYPADKNNIRPGDILLEVDSVSVKQKSLDDVFPLLRGVPGTVVRVKLFRPSTKSVFVVNATRETVQLPSVPYYGELSPGQGYIKITGETAQTFDEVKAAFMALKKTDKLKGLVMDLRGNTGGYMSQALKVANLFLSKGKVAVSQKSWYSDTTDYFPDEPEDTNMPLVLLVDNLTVSAGEILAGALQDHDRAILIGQKTFGKGMVQRLFDMPDGDMLKVTTAFYYTPSGRCIQRKEKGGALTQSWTDSSKKIVYTANGRPLVSYDGIAPDIVLPMPPEPAVVQDLLNPANTHVFRFANDYMKSHSKIAPASEFRLTNADYEQFIIFLKKQTFKISSASEEKINELEKVMVAEGFKENLMANIATLRKQIALENEQQFVTYKNQIMSLLEQEIACQYYYNWGRMQNAIKDDEAVTKAVEVLSNWNHYKELLQPKTLKQ